MTDEKIKALVKKWQTRLKLDHWDVRVKVVVPSKFRNGNCGDVNYDCEYLNATIRLSRDLSRAELPQIAIHELLHLHLAPMGVVDGTPEHKAEEQAAQILSRVIKEAYEN